MMMMMMMMLILMSMILREYVTIETVSKIHLVLTSMTEMLKT